MRKILRNTINDFIYLFNENFIIVNNNNLIFFFKFLKNKTISIIILIIKLKKNINF